MAFFSFVNSRKKREESDKEGENVKRLEKKFLDWRRYVAEKMDGIEINLEGVKYNLSVEISVSDVFKRMRKDWEELYAFQNRRNRGLLFERRKAKAGYDCVKRGSITVVRGAKSFIQAFDAVDAYYFFYIWEDKQGSRLSADYEVTLDKDGFFRNSRSQNQEKSSRMQEPAAVLYRAEAPKCEPHISQSSNDTRRKKEV